MNSDFVIIISADAEWLVVKKIFSPAREQKSPYGTWFEYQYSQMPGLDKRIIFFHGGWGKVAAAGSAQYVITTWRPKLVINLGTCGGLSGHINIGDIVLAESTVIYDIYEQMGDPDEHIKYYTTKINTSWLYDPLPLTVIRTKLVSADRDLICEEINSLRARFGAIAGDWESGAIAWVADKNNTLCLILRGVTDLVNDINGDAYLGNINLFYQNSEMVMDKLIESLPSWIFVFISRTTIYP